MTTAQKLLDTCKKENRQLEQIWRVWKDQYLLNLREEDQKFNKHPSILSQNEACICKSRNRYQEEHGRLEEQKCTKRDRLHICILYNAVRTIVELKYITKM